MSVSRRTLLLGSAAVFPLSTMRIGPARSDPFTLVVASGDPEPDGVVLCTRLAVTPTAEDGLGGMPTRPIEVQWELAADERFRRIVQSGSATAVPAKAHSVHVVLNG